LSRYGQLALGMAAGGGGRVPGLTRGLRTPDPSALEKAKTLFRNQGKGTLREVQTPAPTVDQDAVPKGFWRNLVRAWGEAFDNLFGGNDPAPPAQ